jgi:hypothetical protein
LIIHDTRLVIDKLFFAVLTVEVLYYVLSIIGKETWITLLLYTLAIDILQLVILALDYNLCASFSG